MEEKEKTAIFCTNNVGEVMWAMSDLVRSRLSTYKTSMVMKDLLWKK